MPGPVPIAAIDCVRRLVQGLPEVDEGTSYGTPAWKVRRKTFARLKEDGETLAIWIGLRERTALTQMNPDAYFVTPHYDGYPMMLVRVAAAPADELGELLIEAWRMKAPKRLLAAYDADHPAPAA